MNTRTTTGSAITIAALLAVAVASSAFSAEEGPARGREHRESRIAGVTSGTLESESEGPDSAEEAVSLEALPAPARAAIEKEAGAGATITKVAKEREGGREAYEADFRRQDAEGSVKVGADGAVVEIEKNVDEASLPPAVEKTLARVRGKGKVREAVAVTSYFYEIKVEENGHVKEVKIDPLGRVQAKDEADEEEEHHGEKKDRGEKGEQHHGHEGEHEEE
jgi:hypothetical protein